MSSPCNGPWIWELRQDMICLWVVVAYYRGQWAHGKAQVQTLYPAPGGERR